MIAAAKSINGFFMVVRIRIAGGDLARAQAIRQTILPGLMIHADPPIGGF